MVNKSYFAKGLILGLALVLFYTNYALAAEPREAVKTLTEAIETEQELLSDGEKWEREQVVLAQEIKQAKLESEWYNLHIKTLERYVATAKENVANLLTTQEEVLRLEAALEANLVLAVELLKTFLKNDLPFLQKERADRLAFIEKSLNDYTLGLEEKLRRVFEALQVESDYAKQFEITEESIETSDGKHTVKLLRIGRVGLFALAPDKTKAWQYTPEGYKELPPEYLTSLQILQGENIQSLPILPFSVFGEAK